MIEREEKAMRRAYIKQIITTVLLIVMVLNGGVCVSAMKNLSLTAVATL